MISVWVKKYREGGIEALENKHKPGNLLARYTKRKELSFYNQKEKCQNFLAKLIT